MRRVGNHYMIVWFLFWFSLIFSGCTDGNTAKRVLTTHGYTNIQITGYRFTGCGKDDAFSTGFKAINPVGNPVSGVVCSGWFKGSTVRFD